MKPYLAACLPRWLWCALPGVAIAVALLAPGLAASAAVCERGQLQARLAEIDPHTRPDPDGGPTDVSLGLLLNDLHSIDEVRERFTADLRAELTWRDARLTPEALGCEAAGARPLIDTIWHPELMMMNGIDVDSSLQPRAVIGPGGRVRFVRRYTGVFGASMALEDFPLQTQQLGVLVGTVQLGPDQVRVRIDPDRSGILDAMVPAGWSLETPSSEVGTARLADVTINRIRFVFPARRLPGYFAYKVVLPLALIVAMSWSVFWLDPKHLQAQLGVASASVLTAIAFQLSLVDLLPQIPYLTRMDRFVLGSTVLVFAALAEVIWTSNLSVRDRLALARRLDRLARYLFPALYTAFTIWCFA